MKPMTLRYEKPAPPKQRGLGDVVHAIAQPVAAVIDAVLGTDLKNCGGCDSRRKKLNQKYPL